MGVEARALTKEKLIEKCLQLKVGVSFLAPEDAGEVIVFSMINDSGAEERVVSLSDAHRCFNFRKPEIEIILDTANGEAAVEWLCDTVCDCVRDMLTANSAAQLATLVRAFLDDEVTALTPSSTPTP